MEIPDRDKKLVWEDKGQKPLRIPASDVKNLSLVYLIWCVLINNLILQFHKK